MSDPEVTIGTEFMPDGHVAFAATDDNGIVAFAATGGRVHVHLFRPDGSLECLALATPEHAEEWMRRLYATVKVAQRTDSNGVSEEEGGE